MVHPLVENIELLKVEEVDAKISDLTRKYYMTTNIYVKEQIANMLNIYVAAAQEKRQAELFNEMTNKNKDLDKLINFN